MIAKVPQLNRRRILFIDDEESMVMLATWFLERLGYEVSGYMESDPALAALQANPSAFDLVVTDQNMLGPSGLDVAREAMRLRPDLPVAIISGYVTRDLRDRAAALGVREVIEKPNRAEDMAQAIARLLSRLAVVPPAIG
ncbi:MAG TPA: response regulator [Steroidobacteraceae bacterium]|nr:response regulator [Steroidobacteraceae bacterium]